MEFDLLLRMSEEGKAVPLTKCGCCGGTIWKYNYYQQCPDCGCQTTPYGGMFPYIPMKKGDKFSPPKDFLNAIKASKQLIDNAKRDKIEHI